MTGTVPGAASLVVRRARVVDGSGAAAYEADLLVTGDSISGIVPAGTGAARDVIDARGMVVCPGFIDTHAHDDALVLKRSTPHPKLSRGVTTVVTGNGGISLAPLVAGLDGTGLEGFRFKEFADYLRALDDVKPAVNVVALLGHTNLRVRHVRDLGRTANRSELDAMKLEVGEALDVGAFGLSTAFCYPPACVAGTEELLEVCGPVGARKAILAMHLHEEIAGVEEAIREALFIGERSGARLVLSRHKTVGNQKFGRTRETLELITEDAQMQTVCLDCCPYEGSSTMLVQRRGLLGLEQAVHKMTGLAAQRFGLHERGAIAVGKAADLVILDPSAAQDNGTYENLAEPAGGIEAVLVNGRLALWRGEHLNLHAGKRLVP